MDMVGHGPQRAPSDGEEIAMVNQVVRRSEGGIEHNVGTRDTTTIWKRATSGKWAQADQCGDT